MEIRFDDFLKVDYNYDTESLEKCFYYVMDDERHIQKGELLLRPSENGVLIKTAYQWMEFSDIDVLVDALSMLKKMRDLTDVTIVAIPPRTGQKVEEEEILHPE